MLDHVGFNVRDLARSVAFYEAALAPLGLRVMERHGDAAVVFHGNSADPAPAVDQGSNSAWSSTNTR